MTELAVMFGAGNVGRGFLGQLFSESGMEVVFVDVDETLIRVLNARKSYFIRLVDNEYSEKVQVSPVRAYHSRQSEEVGRALAQATIAATAVGARALSLIAPLIAKGVVERQVNGRVQPLNFIICENLHGAAEFFRNMVIQYIPASCLEYFKTKIGFVETVIGRMVPPPTPEMRAEDPSQILVEPYKELPVDRLGFIGSPPEIVGMQVCDNFPAYTARKLYLHNCGHAVLGYLGYLHGYQYGYEALVDQVIRPIFEKALDESVHGIVKQFGVEERWLKDHQADLTRRFANRALGDTNFRLGRDPLRKLAANDRLVGAARLAEKAGVLPEGLSWGIAGGFAFNAPEDPMAVELQARLTREDFKSVLADVSQIQPGELLAELVFDRYKRLRHGIKG